MQLIEDTTENRTGKKYLSQWLIIFFVGIMKMKPVLGITMGDPAGIGPEIIVKAFASKEMKKILEGNRPFVIGDADVLRQAMEFSNVKVNVSTIQNAEGISEAKFKFGMVNVLDLDNVNVKKLKMGKVQAMCGRASIDYIKKAAELATDKKIHAIVTAPINKQSIKKAGHPYPGHTETLAVLTGISPDDVTMMLVIGNFRVFHATLHQSLKDAIKNIKKDKVLETIRVANRGLKSLGIKNPNIAVAGLNPHASDGGRFGNEELEEIEPAVKIANGEGINAIGPIPADTVFLRASKGEFDGVVALYHDQGHIPAKMLGFMKGVNVTVGLPIIRTSVDHGTAFDIAGRGVADCTNMIEAIKVASTMAKAKFSSD